MSKLFGWPLKSWLKSLMFKRMHGMISCREFEDFVQAYVDGELPGEQSKTFERHIRFCRDCRQYLEAYQRTVDVVGSLKDDPDGPVPEDVPEDLIQAILKAQEE